MIDGIRIQLKIEDFEQWQKHINHTANVTFQRSLDIFTGELTSDKQNNRIVTKYWANYRKYKLKVTEVDYGSPNIKPKHYLTINGSLHKSYFAGKNVERFTFEDMQKEIDQLCGDLHMNPSDAQIKILEVGMNLPFFTSPYKWLDESLLVYKAIPFNRYAPDTNNRTLGFHVHLTQYEVKVYDKGKQFELPYNLLRFEKRFIKMQPLKKYGIFCLSDLQDKEKVFQLIDTLIKCWDNVLISEPLVNLYQLEPKEYTLYENGKNSKQWKNWHKENYRKYKHKRDKFGMIISKYGENRHKIIRDVILKEWNVLMGMNNIEVNVFTLYLNGKNIHFSPLLDDG